MLTRGTIGGGVLRCLFEACELYWFFRIKDDGRCPGAFHAGCNISDSITTSTTTTAPEKKCVPKQEVGSNVELIISTDWFVRTLSAAVTASLSSTTGVTAGLHSTAWQMTCLMMAILTTMMAARWLAPRGGSWFLIQGGCTAAIDHKYWQSPQSWRRRRVLLHWRHQHCRGSSAMSWRLPHG